MQNLTELQVLALAQANAIMMCELVPTPGGWTVRLNGDKILRSARLPARVFAKADTALAYLAEFGIARVTIDLNGWQRG